MLAAFHNELNLILKNKFEFADHLAMDYKNGLVPDTNNVAAVTALLTMCTNLKEEFNKKIEAYDRRFQSKFCSYFCICRPMLHNLI